MYVVKVTRFNSFNKVSSCNLSKFINFNLISLSYEHYNQYDELVFSKVIAGYN